MRGEILFDPNYKFLDGETSPKILVALNNPSTTNVCLLALTTSKKNKFRDTQSGCAPTKQYYGLRKDEDWFHEDFTWVRFDGDRLVSLTHTEYISRGISGKLKLRGTLKDTTLRSIINCILKSQDVPLEHQELLKKEKQLMDAEVLSQPKKV